MSGQIIDLLKWLKTREENSRFLHRTTYSKENRKPGFLGFVCWSCSRHGAKVEGVVTIFDSHQFDVGELLGDSERVIAQGQHVSLDGRLGFGFQSGETFRRRGVDLDQGLLVLAEHSQPPDEPLAHLADGLPVNLMEEEREETQR